MEAISPLSSNNPQNVQNVEAIFPEQKFNEFFPTRNSAYTYTNFLKAIGKYPSICSDAALCPKILANMFAHFQQETAGLVYLREINKSNYCATWSNWSVENTRRMISRKNLSLFTRVTAAYPCSPGKQYYGRGAKQLSWNYNYGTLYAEDYQA